MRNSDNDFILYKHFSGKGYVYLMAGLDKTNSDYNDLLSIACYFAKKGKTVWNRPNVYEKGAGKWLYHKKSGREHGSPRSTNP